MRTARNLALLYEASTSGGRLVSYHVKYAGGERYKGQKVKKIKKLGCMIF
jgi:hypothetical protein